MWFRLYTLYEAQVELAVGSAGIFMFSKSEKKWIGKFLCWHKDSENNPRRTQPVWIYSVWKEIQIQNTRQKSKFRHLSSL